MILYSMKEGKSCSIEKEAPTDKAWKDREEVDNQPQGGWSQLECWSMCHRLADLKDQV